MSRECRRCNLVFEENFGALDTFDRSDAKLISLLKNGFLNPVLPDLGDDGVLVVDVAV